MPNVNRTFQLFTCWIIALSWHFSCGVVVAQNSTNTVSARYMDSQAVQSQAKERSDLDEILSNRLHELFGTPSGEKPNFVAWPMSQTRRHDVAKGVILFEEKDVLYLARPCNNEVLTFRNPYTKKRTGSEVCNGKKVDIYVVEQG